jgi:antitoxin component of RelBE/YafQ-DinJ toxin-antitoxin module
MVYLRIKDNTPAAKKMLEYLKIMPYVEIIEKNEIPNEKTLKAIQEAEKGKLKKFKTVKDLMKSLND